jgi:hypothetical protein
MEVLFQLMPGSDWISWLVWILFMVVFFFFYPRIMVSQIMWKLESTARELEEMSDKSKEIVIKSISKTPDKKLKDSVNSFFEFFMIQPVSMDPYGYVAKLDFVIKNQRDRFRDFVKEVAPDKDEETRANIEMGLAGGITVHEISKIVRHYVEMVRETKNIQIAMVLQMQLPMIEKIARAMYKGTNSLSKGEIIGDGLGPLVAAELSGKDGMKPVGDDMVMAKIKMNGRTVYLMKAKGPGGRVGDPGKAVDIVIRKNRVTRVITVDAAAKLHGEKSGSLAEGVGIAMGGPGVERFYIEKAVTEKRIPIDSIVVKMSQEEAITPMRKVIKDAIPNVKESINRSLERTKKGDTVLLVGVGNTSGVGNNGKAARDAMDWVEKNERKIKQEQSKKKKKKGDED